jgi:hypothetical protein
MPSSPPGNRSAYDQGPSSQVIITVSASHTSGDAMYHCKGAASVTCADGMMLGMMDTLCMHLCTGLTPGLVCLVIRMQLSLAGWHDHLQMYHFQPWTGGSGVSHSGPLPPRQVYMYPCRHADKHSSKLRGRRVMSGRGRFNRCRTIISDHGAL